MGRWTYAQKMRQASHEAKVAGVGLAATAAVWAALGFGLSGLDATVLGVPVWVVAGCLGTWAFAVAFSVWMARRVVVDVPLDDDGLDEGTRAEEDDEGGRS